MNSMNLKMGITVGTLFSMVSTVNAGNLLETAMMAAVGASVSFGLSLIWKFLWRKNRNK